jgi:hypothetical protein
LQSARTADNPAVTIVPNVKIKMNARHSISYLSLHDLFGKALFYLYKDPSSNTQVANREQVVGTVIQVIRHKGSASLRQNSNNLFLSNNPEPDIARLSSTAVINHL